MACGINQFDQLVFVFYSSHFVLFFEIIFYVACFNSYVERLLNRISNGVLAEDRRTAMAELQSIVAESRGAQLAFGAMGMHFLFLV